VGIFGYVYWMLGVVLGECFVGSDVRWVVAKREKPWHPSKQRDCARLLYFINLGRGDYQRHFVLNPRKALPFLNGPKTAQKKAQPPY